jgi:bilirubin oxidase
MLTRRQFINSILATTVFPQGVALAFKKVNYKNEFFVPPLDTGKRVGRDVYFDLKMQSGISKILPNKLTKTWGINQSFLGVTLKVKEGDKLHVNVTNKIDKTTTLHWHGVKLPAKADGGPHQPILPGGKWLSEYEIIQPAATLWYHSHQMHETGEQVYNGLAGMMIVEDDKSDKLGLPSEYGVNDFPVILQDKKFNEDGSLDYIGRFDLQEGMMGMMGDTVLVNGVNKPKLKAKESLIRLRILNGSNARIYKLEFDDKRKFEIIGSDGGLLEKPEVVSQLTISPAERIEIVVNLSEGGMPMLRHVIESGAKSVLPAWVLLIGGEERGKEEFDIMQIDARGVRASNSIVPNELSIHDKFDEKSIAKHRRMVLRMGSGSPITMVSSAIFGSKDLMTINNKSMDINRIDEVVKAGTIEVWSIENSSRIAHPFHIHNVQFKIIKKTSKIEGHELGFKDVVLVQPGETVDVIMKFPEFSDAKTPYMYHCHILEHEDRGMMGQFVVV